MTQESMHPTYVVAVTDQPRRPVAGPRRGESEQLRSRLVGFNPFRQQDKTRTDLIVVITFLVITLAVVLWAFVGG